jgi:hypothetical protein
MKWVVLAIFACLVPYTLLTLKYRKPGPAYEPYEEGKNRANTARLLENGYQRLSVVAERAADPARESRAITSAATITEISGGLPEDLAGTLVEPPELAQTLTSVLAARTATALLPYPILFNCTLADHKRQFSGADLYVKGDTIAIVPKFEPIQGQLLARTTESCVVVTLPGGTLKAGRYTFTIAARQHSKQWSLEVK